MQEAAYRYQILTLKFLLSIGFFAICAANLFYLAYTNTSALVINGVFHLTPQQACIFYGALGVLSAIFVLLAAYVVFQGGLKPRQIIIRKHDVVLPSLQGKERIVPFDLITEATVTIVRRQHFLTIKWRGTPAIIHVMRMNMPDAGAFEDLCAKLTAIMQAQKAKQSVGARNM